MKRLLTNLLLLVVSLAAACALAEGIVYWRYGKKILISPRYVTEGEFGDFRIRRNIPNSHYRHKCYNDSWEFSIDSEGFRDTRDFAYRKPEGTVRVLVLGDSFTIGYEVDQSETYAAVIERYLEKRGIRAEVINAGMSGSSNAEELVVLQTEGIKYDPDVVVVGFFRNDIGDNTRAGLFRLEGDSLVVARREYLPAVGTRDFLNAIPLYRWLSEHSYLHNYLNRVATILVKKRFSNQIREKIGGESWKEHSATVRSYEANLARAILGRMRDVAHRHGAWMIVLDVARQNLEPSLPDAGGEALDTIADRLVYSSRILEKYKGLTPLYGSKEDGGRGHWMPFSHLMVGMELGRIIEEHLAVSAGESG